MGVLKRKEIKIIFISLLFEIRDNNHLGYSPKPSSKTLEESWAHKIMPCNPIFKYSLRFVDIRCIVFPKKAPKYKVYCVDPLSWTFFTDSIAFS
jgi:hypothetical protein